MALEKVQIGVESPAAHGTAVAADTMLLAKLKYAPDQAPVIPADDIGLNVNGYRAVLGGKLVTNTLEFERGYFQALPLLFSLLMKGGVTAAEKTVGKGDYEWDFTPDLDSSNTLDSATLEFGDSVQAFEDEYVTGEKLKISGSVPQSGGDAPVALSLDFFARQHTKTTFTPAIAAPVVNELSGFLTRLFVDPSWATAGTTEKTGILRAFDIEIIGGAYPQFHGGQALTFDDIAEGKKAILANFTLDNGADAMALYDALGTMKVFQLLLEGPEVASGGEKHSLTIQFSGIVMEPKPGDSKDQETSLTTVSIEGIYDPTGTKLLVPKVVTNVQTL